MTATWPLPFVLVLGVTATRAAGPAVTIDTVSPSGQVSPLFGLLSADPQATNAIDTPERVVPVTSTVTGVESGFTDTVRSMASSC
jgi:hypothetical protein